MRGLDLLGGIQRHHSAAHDGAFIRREKAGHTRQIGQATQSKAAKPFRSPLKRVHGRQSDWSWIAGTAQPTAQILNIFPLFLCGRPGRSLLPIQLDEELSI